MKIRIKMIVMLLCMLTVLGIIIGNFSMSYFSARKELLKSSNAVMELSMALQTLINLQHFIESSLCYIQTQESPLAKEVDHFEKEIETILREWEVVSHESDALGVENESEDIHRLQLFRALYSNILDYKNEAFKNLLMGRRDEALSIINHYFMSLEDETLPQIIEESVADEFGEVETAYEKMIAAIGSIAWMSEKSLRKAHSFQHALNDLITLSYTHYFIERQFQMFTQPDVTSQSIRKSIQFGALAEKEMQKWEISTKESLDFGVAEEISDLDRVRNVRRLYRKIASSGMETIEKKISEGKNQADESLSDHILSEDRQNLHEELVKAFKDERDEIESSYEDLKEFIHYDGLFHFGIMIGITAAIIIFSISIIFRLLTSVQKLTLAAHLLERGNLSHRIHLSGKDEFTQLGISFNRMADEIKNSHSNLEALNHDLETHVERRTIELSETVFRMESEILERKAAETALEKAKKEAEMANEAKSLFLANMSHEIRTPLNGVLGMIRFLLDSNLTGEQREWAQAAKTSGKALLSIINDILDYSKIEANRMEVEHIQFNLRELMEDMADILSISAHAKHLEFTALIGNGVPVILTGDPGRLRQILINLGNNAIKFTENGEVNTNVSIHSEKDAHIMLRFEVKDTGIGIPEDRMGRLFNSFSQLDPSTSRKYGGTGLGLAISRELSRLMGGKMGVESIPGKGSTFWFTIRFDKTDNEKETGDHLPVNLKGARVLIIDDSPASRNVLRNLLSPLGCRCKETSSGKEGLLLLETAEEKKNPFQFAFIDSELKGESGKILSERIRSEASFSDIRLIMLPSLGRIGDAVDFKRRGFDAYVSKPVKQSQLYACLASLTRQGKENFFLENGKKEKKTLPAGTFQRNIRILVAEDNTINQKICLTLFEKLGFQTEIVSNGKDAIEALSLKRFDIVFMDIQMPEMDGYSATQVIRDPSSPVKNHHIPIIALTANAMRGDKEKSLQSGMNDYMSKPIEPELLLEKIEKWAVARTFHVPYTK